ncbi:MAG: tetratricopeptide repeat protein [Bacteroidales bacterium]|nr:tetratricopeptide repeat protein [Bacteroidales bacterium]
MKNLTRILVIMMLSAACLLHASPLSAQSETYMDAIRSLQEGDYAKAARLLKQEMAANPGNDAACYYYANILMASGGNPDNASIEKNLKKALELSPDNYWYKYTLALFYQQTERPELCSRLLEELIASHPKKSSLYFDAASAYLQQNDVDNALASLDKISAIGGKSEMIAIAKMDLLMKKGGDNGKEAYEFLEKYYEDCKTPRLASMLGDWYQQTYRDSLAIARYSEAIEMDGTYSPAYYGRAHVYQTLRQYDNYFNDIHKFLGDKDMDPRMKSEYIINLMEVPQFIVAFPAEIDSMMVETHMAHPTDSALNNAISLYYYRTDRNYYAIELMRQNTELYPDSYTLAFQYLLMLYYSKSWAGVTEEATEILKKWPENHDALLVRGDAYRRIGDNEAAIKDYEAMAATAPKDSTVIMQTYPSLGDLYFQTGNVSKSFKCYQKALKCDPDNSMVLNNYAYYMSLGKIKLKKAKEMSKKTIEKEPDNPTYLDTYAWILHLMGDDVEAKAVFKHAMLYGGKEQAAILDHYAEVLFSLKEYDLAYIYWNQAKAALTDPSEIEKIDKKLKERHAQQEAR